jgi:hypothetical protein
MKAEGHWNAHGIQDIVDALQAVKSGKAELQKPGKMYQVGINADPEHFLDWDKPLSEQSQKVQDALMNAADKAFDQSPDAQELYRSLRAGSDKFDVRRALEMLSNPWEKGVGGASQALRQAGIPGIKYLDRGSRTAGEGSRNYVVFDDKLIDIIKKYGWAALGLGPLAPDASDPLAQ